MSETTPKEQWSSRWGFILAASGSAIGLGNIVFFSANAYKYGAGAFYVPYLIALLVVGIPLMILEFGLGYHSREAFPQSLRRFGGKGGEFVGWWAIINATIIVMYYVTILAWVVGMFVGSFGSDLWQLPEAGDTSNPQQDFFFGMTQNWYILAFVGIVWALNVLIVWKGVSSIESVTKFLVPLMWLLMIALIIQGLTFKTGFEGVKLLFTPQFDVMKDAAVWRGAFGQIFFSLSLGFGIMTAYTSRLSRNTDIPSTAMSTSFMNCSFEFIAGIAIFALLFHFAVAPQASTLGMMFWVVPQGIAHSIASLGIAAKIFGILFFFLLLIAGLSSSISLVEALAAAAIDKFGISRKKVVTIIAVVGLLGSAVFAWPALLDGSKTTTIGLTMLDFTDHWTFGYGLMIIGILECLILGWSGAVDKVTDSMNAESRTLQLGKVFGVMIRWIIPAVLIILLGLSLYEELDKGGLYNFDTEVSVDGTKLSAGKLAFFGWLTITTVTALALTLIPGRKKEEV